MILDQKTFTVSEWAGFTTDQWATFELDPTMTGLRWYVEAADVYQPGAETGAVYTAGAEQGEVNQ